MNILVWLISLAVLGWGTLYMAVCTISGAAVWLLGFMKGWVVFLFGILTLALGYALIDVALFHHPF